MVQVLLLGHGNLPVELLHSVELILGKQSDDVIAIPLNPGDDMKEYSGRIETLVENNLKTDGTLIFTDIMGGSPFITASQVYRTQRDRGLLDIITGMNLPMVIEALSMRENATLEELIKIAMTQAKKSVHLFSAVFEEQRNRMTEGQNK